MQNNGCKSINLNAIIKELKKKDKSKPIILLLLFKKIFFSIRQATKNSFLGLFANYNIFLCYLYIFFFDFDSAKSTKGATIRIDNHFFCVGPRIYSIAR